LEVDQCPREDTRKAAYKKAKYAYLYAKDIDKKSSKIVQNIVCKDPLYAFYYLKDIDHTMHKNIIDAIYKTSRSSYLFIKNFQYSKKAKEKILESSMYSYFYATKIEKCFSNETFTAVKNTKYEEKYKTFFNKKMKKEII
jgi:hypothetical protein